jgi:hypothetical protein
MRFPRARGTLITSEATHAASFTISLEMVGAYRADGGEHFQLNPVCADPAFVVVHERVVQTHRPTQGFPECQTTVITTGCLIGLFSLFSQPCTIR